MSDICNTLFKGHKITKLDEKNRIVIWSKFRNQITVPQVLVCRGRVEDYPLLELKFSFPQVQPEMNIEEKMRNYSFGDLCNIRGEGRIAVPKAYFEYISEKRELKEIAQCGGGDRIYIFNAGDFTELDEKNTRENLKIL